jgi:hypothetical protein
MANIIPEENPRILNPDSFEAKLREYIKLKSTETILKARAEELRVAMFEKLDLEGEEDSNGNLLIDFEEPIEGVVRLEKQRRSSRKVDETVAEAIIFKHGLTGELYETKLVLNEDALMAAFYEGKISEEELDEMFPVTTTWALRIPKK